MKAKAVAVLVWFLTALAIKAIPEPQIGSVLRHLGAYEISIIYSEPVDVGSLGNPENYSVAPGSIVSLRLCATNQGVILTVQGLAPGNQGAVNINNMLDASGNLLPAASLDFKAPDRLWAAIGANELGFTPDVVGFPDDGFDLFSGGVQQRDEYDDATFVGEKITGNFDVKVRVDYVEPAGAGAKAGIMIREQLDEGKTRPLDPDDPAQAFSRYVELSVQAPVSALGDPGAGHQIWQRAVSPSVDTLPLTINNNAAPDFPNAWLRVERLSQEFNMYRSIDGQHWVQLGSASFDPPLSTNVYVGLAFSPQNDDIPFDTGLRKSFVAKFRQYELIPKAEDNLRIQMSGDHAEVLWDSSATLQTAATLTGQWTDLPTATSPYRVDLTEAARFYRLKQ
jgi:hypothetical protein